MWTTRTYFSRGIAQLLVPAMIIENKSMNKYSSFCRYKLVYLKFEFLFIDSINGCHFFCTRALIKYMYSHTRTVFFFNKIKLFAIRNPYAYIFDVTLYFFLLLSIFLHVKPTSEGLKSVLKYCIHTSNSR